jgi:asparagine synthetase B (glutamine-hydrolysing)
MYTFVAGVGLGSVRQRRGLPARALLREAAAQLVRHMPDLGTPPAIDCLELPEMDGGWVTIRPRDGAHEGLISERSDAEHAILVRGQIAGEARPAERVHDAWTRAGVDAVSELTGVFSALIVERRARRLTVVTSMLGARPVRYCVEAGALLLSPIDLGLVALGRRAPAIDLGALAALVACGWPLAGGTGLVGVQESQSHEHLVWQNGLLTSAPAHPFQRRPRLEAGDSVGIARKIDEVIEELRDGVRRHLAGDDQQRIRVPLTAGMDSRAVLALLLSVAGAERLTTFTNGISSQDVRVARRLSRQLGLQHQANALEPPSPIDFVSNARFLSILNNGISNAQAAARVRLTLTPALPAPFGGGGELFRGYYYKYLWRHRAAPEGPAGLFRALLTSPFARLWQTRFATPELDAEPSQRLRRAIAALTHISHDAHDLSDLFFFFESMSRWASTCWRPCLCRPFMPFANGRAVAAAFQLPSPLGDHAILPRLIARYSPRSAYWTPFNGSGLLCLEGSGWLRQATRELLRVGAKVVRERRQSCLPRERGPKHARLGFLRGELRDAIVDTLRSTHSLARRLFTPEQLDRMLDSKGHQLSHFTLAGAVFSLELWKRTLDETSALP